MLSDQNNGSFFPLDYLQAMSKVWETQFAAGHREGQDLGSHGDVWQQSPTDLSKTSTLFLYSFLLPPSPNADWFHAPPLSPQIHTFNHSWLCKLLEFASSINQGLSNLLPTFYSASQIWTQKVMRKQTLIPNTDCSVSSLRKEQFYQKKRMEKSSKKRSWSY